MKKFSISKLALLALPLAVVAIAIQIGSVTVVQGDEVRYTSFAEAVVGSSVGWCAPVALVLTYAIFGLAVFYLVTKKDLLLNILRGASFVAACLASCPILVSGEVRVLPNAFAGLLLMALWLISHILLKAKNKEEKEEKPVGKRLSRR